MTYDVNWDDPEQTIIRVDVDGTASWEAYHRSIDDILRLAGDTTDRVDIVFNDKVGLPPGNPIPHFKHSIERLQKLPELGLVVAVTGHGLPMVVRPFVELVMSVYKLDSSHEGDYVRSMDEARQLIARSRAQERTGSIN